MSETILTQAPAKSNGVTKVCLRPGCIHDGEPQPLKRFRGREKDANGRPVIYDDCTTCRWGGRVRKKAEDNDTGLNGYHSPPDMEEQLAAWVLPPGCEVLEVGAAVPGMAREARQGWCDEGEGVKLLTDPRGRPVVKSGFAGLREGEVCYVIR